MLEEVLNSIHNWFECYECEGQFEVKDGTLELPFLVEGQYFRISGSVFNDGLHQYPDVEMKDEAFEGRVSALAIPAAVITIADEVQEWQDKYGDTFSSPYQSESFGGYSYNKGGATGGTDGTSPGGWEAAFRSRLNAWRKL